MEIAPVNPITKRFLAGSLPGKLGLYCMAGNWVGIVRVDSWLDPGQVGNRRNQPRMKFIVGNWSGTSRALVKYPGECLELGIYSKPMRPIQKSVSEPIRVIPNKSKARFDPYQSEAHLKSIRTLNPNESEIDRIHSD